MVYRALKVLKGYVDVAFGPLARLLHFFGVKPTHLTLLSLPFGVYGAWFVFDDPLPATAAVTLYFIFDFMDGTLARVTGTHSDFGARLDFAVDRVVAATFLLSYFFNEGAVLLPAVGLALMLFISLEDFKINLSNILR
ncbi:MAG: CDP-alcohol phosphatidyltransferase family protein [Candidatus Altiarchaeota archaeon]|nr:CDP-alcohol phosphatidyltransferase family protein [Candidatus Altiarchaeota archaeon]